MFSDMSVLCEFSGHVVSTCLLELDSASAELEDSPVLELDLAFEELEGLTLLEDFAELDILTLLEESGLNELDDLALLELDDTFLDEEDVSAGESGPVLELSPQAENVSPNRADMVKAVTIFLICMGTPLGLISINIY